MLFIASKTSQQASSKYTPFELLYKHKPRLPIEISTLLHGVDAADMQEVRAEDLDAHMQPIIEWAEEVNARSKSNIEKAHEKQKKRFDAKHKPPTFQPGDKVWVYKSQKDTREEQEEGEEKQMKGRKDSEESFLPQPCNQGILDGQMIV